jgi:hypothetical protein
MFALVDQGQISSPLVENQDPSISNAEYLKHHSMNLLANAFGHVQK